MKWLTGYTLASLMAAFLIMRLCDYILAGTREAVASTVKLGLFTSIWTAVTTGAGMRAFTQRVRELRQKNRGVARWVAHREKEVP